MTEPTLTIGTGRCRCTACGRSFSSVSTYDRHMKIAKNGDAICLDPTERGLVLNNGWWTGPSPVIGAVSDLHVRPTRDENPEPAVSTPSRVGLFS